MPSTVKLVSYYTYTYTTLNGVEGRALQMAAPKDKSIVLKIKLKLNMRNCDNKSRFDKFQFISIK